MLHSVGSVKMAVMARHLSAGRLSQTMAEEATRQKRVSNYIHKQLCGADEANLLDEKDMHVFDLKPMTDTLHLVCCNACKKPIKASQYGAHAELCRSLMSTGEFLSDHQGDTGPKRPPKMVRKRSKAAGKVSLPVGQKGNKKVDTSDAAVSRFRVVGQDGPMSSVITNTNVGPRPTNSSSTHGNCLTSSNAKVTAAAAGIVPLPKRPKRLAADMVQSSEDVAAGRDGCNLSSSRSLLTYVPAPLATKTYYSQRNSYLRNALSYMYHKGATRHLSDEASPNVSEGNFITSELTSPRIIYAEEQLVQQAQEKSIAQNLPSLPNTIANDAIPSQIPDVEKETRLYSSNPCPVTANPGSPMATLTQPDGNVPIV